VKGKDFYVLRIGGNKHVVMKNLGWNVPEQVHFLGVGEIPDSKVLHAYLASDVLVFTSLEEGFGLPLAEAM
jgi:glycosyltransferase involved in cell wall biosynthesis